MMLEDIIYGKNKETNIVNISVKDDTVFIFKEFSDGVYVEEKPYRHWVLTPKSFDDSCVRLKGNEYFKYYKDFDSTKEFFEAKKNLYKYGMYTAHNFSENFMMRNGYTYFKGMKTSEVSMLSFDIETTGLDPQADDAEVLLVTNTYRKGDYYESRTFCTNDYASDAAMLLDWANWVCELDPSLLLGHNIVLFDIPYILQRCPGLPLGRFGTELTLDSFPREFRKDGSQTYTYHRVNCFGREVVDTFFVAIKADISRKYENYRLKGIIKQEGLEEEGRQHYDASLIRKNWHNPEERKKIIAYAEADSRDPIKLFDLMIPSFFYLTPYIPKPFQIMTESATGSQINALMVRSYLQADQSVAKDSPAAEFQGAVSFGNVGIYDNVFKVDVASLYPSIMRYYEIFPKGKDYNNNFLKMLNYFTDERLKNKKLAKETKERFYDDLQNAQKIVINSAYGFMGASGLNYNYPEGAALVTKYGREIITKSIEWATGRTIKHVPKVGGKKDEYEWVLAEQVCEGKGYTISNCDTDSISFTAGDLSLDQRKAVLDDLNSQFPSAIRFEDDGFFKRVCILKAKNYILWDGKKIKLKGSSIKDQKKEAALREMMDKMIAAIINQEESRLGTIYKTYIKEAMNPGDIKRWASKKTITKAILDCEDNPEARLNERKVWDAVKAIPGLQEGDKVYLYPNIVSKEVTRTQLKNGKIKEKINVATALKNADAWAGDHDPDKLVERVVMTVDIFSNVIDNSQFVDYTLVKNKPLLEGVISEAF